MNHFTPDLIAQAKAAKSAEEIFELAKANHIELTESEAKEYFEHFNANGELSDDDLEAVAGGISLAGLNNEKEIGLNLSAKFG